MRGMPKPHAADRQGPHEAHSHGLLRRVRRTCKEQGVASLWWKGLWDVGVYRWCLVTLFWRTAGAPFESPGIPVTGGVFSRDEIDAYLTLRPDQTRAELETRLDRGDECRVARDQGQLVACSWTAFGRAPLGFLQCEIVLAPDVSYTYDDYVLPAYRRHRVMRAFSQQRREEQLALGFKRLIGIIWPQNVSASVRHRKGKSVTAGVVGCMRVGPWHRPFVRWDPEHVAPNDRPFRIVMPGEPTDG